MKDDKYPGTQDAPTLCSQEQYSKLVAPYIRKAKDTYPKPRQKLTGTVDGTHIVHNLCFKRELDKSEDVFIRAMRLVNHQAIGLLAARTQGHL